jgi:hypothetical protein
MGKRDVDISEKERGMPAHCLGYLSGTDVEEFCKELGCTIAGGIR